MGRDLPGATLASSCMNPPYWRWQGVCQRAGESRGRWAPFTFLGQWRLHAGCKGQGSLCSACTSSKVRLDLSVRAEGILGSWTCCHLPFQPLGWPSAITWTAAALVWFLGWFLTFSLPVGGWCCHQLRVSKLWRYLKLTWTFGIVSWPLADTFNLSTEEAWAPVIALPVKTNLWFRGK